jgi:hypothetical protein
VNRRTPTADITSVTISLQYRSVSGHEPVLLVSIDVSSLLGYVKCKVKVKVTSHRTVHERQEGEWRYSSAVSLTSAIFVVGV